MFGLLGNSIDDPRTIATLQLASGLLGSQNFGQGLSQGLLGYAGTLQDAKRQKQAEEFNALKMEQVRAEMEQMRAAAEQQNRDRTLMQQQFSPLPGPTQDGGPLMPRFDPRSMLAGGASPQAAMNALQLQDAMNPQSKPTILSEGQVAFGPGGERLFDNPKVPQPEKDPEHIRVLKMIYGDGTPAFMRALQQYGSKITTHAPAAQTVVSMGSPVPVTLPDGSQALVQPANRPGVPPQIMRIPGTDQPLRPQAPPVPQSIREKIAQNEVTLRKIDEAISKVEKNPGALGAKNYLPDAIIQRLDPEGVDERAMVADIAGQKIHDRSGAAVTVGEAERLRPYIPNVTDRPDVAKKKLEAFRREYADMQQQLSQGASISQAAGKQDKTKAAGRVAPAPGTVEDGFRFKGGNPADPKNWEPAQ